MDKKDIKGGMGLQPQVDPKSGFCNGVIRAIKVAESYLESNNNLNSLGSIVHNTVEVSRLKELGVRVIDHKELNNLSNSTVLIRAHGEPPSTYKRAKENNIKIIDCTCPVVLKLQERIKREYKELKVSGGTLVIYGKKNHAEVNGLLGQVDGDALVVESTDDLGTLDLTKPIVVFSQTTKDPSAYSAIVEEIKKRVEAAGAEPSMVTVNNTICKQVSSRYPHLREFSASKDVVLFVSGKESSNGKILYETCKSSNPRSYKIEEISEIDPGWFAPGESVGVCGATSTPTWQLNQVAEYVKKM